MYEQHPEFIEPENPDTKIWRFLDIWKFLSLLANESLHFSRGDKFEDPYEGMLTDHIANNIKSSDSVSKSNAFSMWYQNQLNNRYDTYISCWCQSENEPELFWKNSSIAIQSTFKSLIDSIANVQEKIYIGKVRYGDEHLRSDKMPNGFDFWMWKRREFEHERELRALIWRPRNVVVGSMVCKGGKWKVVGYPKADANTPEGIDIPVNPNTLIHQIILSPKTPNWKSQVVKLLISKYGYTLPVSISNLYKLSYL